MARNSCLRLFRAALVAVLAGVPLTSSAVVVQFGLGADDFATLTINGVLLCTYDNTSAAGGCRGQIDLTPGVWYDIVIQYQNRAGSDGLALSWDQPGDTNNGGYGFAGSFPNLVPKANLRTQDPSGAFVSGLRGDYSGSCAAQATVYGEGPINAINNIYNNQAAGSWNGCGYFSLFGEAISGQIQLSPTGVVQLTSPTQFAPGDTTITFDGFDPGTPTNDLYASSGIHFSNIGTSPVPIYDWLGLDRVTTSQPNVIATVSGQGASQFSPFLDVRFDTPKTELGAFFGNDQGPQAIQAIRLTVFDASGNNLGAVSVVPNGNTSVDQFIGLRSNTPFVRARFENLPNAGFSVVLDDVIFDSGGPVPTVSSAVTDLGRPFGAAVHNGVAYVPDPSAHRVWKIDLATGSKSVVAGTGDQGFNGDGIDATLAQLDNPSGVAVDASGALYIADTGNHAIRKIAQPGAPGALITTVAGIPTMYAVGESTLPQCANPPQGFDVSQCAQATSLRLFGPRGVAVDSANRVYIADRMNQQIKRLDPATGYLFVVAGVAGITGNSGGSGVCVPGNPDCVAATFNSPVGLAVDADGSNIYVADEGNNSVRRISEGFVTTFATGALRRPTGVAAAPNGDLYVADYGRHRIQRVSPCLATCDAPLVTTVAGVDGTPGSSPPTGPATSVLLNSPIGVAFDSGVLYIADMVNGRLLGVTIAP